MLGFAVVADISAGVLQLDELLACPLLAVRLFESPRMRVTS